ncbi:MAG TPA: dynamin family protein [Longimicrobium sp.]
MSTMIMAKPESAVHPKLQEMRDNADKTAAGFERLAEVLDGERGLEAAAARLRERAAKLREGRFTLLVLGEFKRGKSTLLNAMLGRDLLPRKAAPCTAILTSLRYGPVPAVRVLFTDGREENLTPEEFTERYELKVEDVVGDEDAESAYYNAMAQDRFRDIDMAEVEYPLELCQYGVELVDSPGLAEHAARERRTLEYLKKADAVILVLDAVNFLNQRERAFINDQLTPLGLRNNLFFLINRWNSVTEGLLNPEDPAEAARVFGEQNQLIDLRLKPLCNVRGEDLSPRRIFKINALGALRERARPDPRPAVLEATQVPAFERSLADFLADDRVRARQAVDRNHLHEALAAVEEHRKLLEANLDSSLDDLKARHAALKPKLDELGRVRVHIENALSALASEIADRMIESFDEHLETHIREPFPQAVEKFNLGRVDKLFVSFDAALDIFRPEGKKFKDGVTAHLQPQIAAYLRPRIMEWAQTVDETYLRTATKRVEEELRIEAEAYAAILGEMGESIGGHVQGIGMQDILRKWLQDFSGPNTSMVNVGVDLTPLLAGIAADVAAELALHMSLHVLPGVGMLLSGIMMLWRRNRMRENVRKQIVDGMNAKLTDYALTQHEVIRTTLRDGFGKLDSAIGGKIKAQIAQIGGDMAALIEEKETREVDATERRTELDEFQERVNQEAMKIRTLLIN